MPQLRSHPGVFWQPRGPSCQNNPGWECGTAATESLRPAVFENGQLKMIAIRGWMRGRPRRHSHPVQFWQPRETSCQNHLGWEYEMTATEYLRPAVLENGQFKMIFFQGWMRGRPERHSHPGVFWQPRETSCQNHPGWEREAPSPAREARLSRRGEPIRPAKAPPPESGAGANARPAKVACVDLGPRHRESRSPSMRPPGQAVYGF